MVASKFAKKYINKYNTTTKKRKKKKKKKQELRLMFGYQPTSIVVRRTVNYVRTC